MFILVSGTWSSRRKIQQSLTLQQTTIEDLIQIKPQDFEKPSAQAIKDAINDKYANKIVPNVGLCICLWDLLSATEGLIGHGTGLVNVNGWSTHPLSFFSHTNSS